MSNRVSGEGTDQEITVSRLPMADVAQLADDLHVELRAWTATSTQALSDFHLEDLAMMVDNVIGSWYSSSSPWSSRPPISIALDSARRELRQERASLSGGR